MPHRSLPCGNLLRPLPAAAAGEDFTDLLVRAGVRVERIVSRGHATPAGRWYDQPLDEWVMVVEGEGELEFADRPATMVLGRGDWVLIPARCRHRVRRTADPTVWLAAWLPPAGTDEPAGGP